MNSDLSDDHPSIHYYDSDYPDPDGDGFPENFDAMTEFQGLAADIARFRGLAADVNGPILDLCCGTGRITLPLARDGCEVTAVDLSAAMLTRLQARLMREAPEVRTKVELVQADVRQLELGRRRFDLGIMGFNSLLCITEFEDQVAALTAIRRHLQDRATLVIDAVNPLVLPVLGEPVPKPFLTRRNVHTGNVYTRFAALGPFDAAQRQDLYGWYDEVGDDGCVRRTPYRMRWRPVFRYELELMLACAGFRVVAVEGGHRREPFTATSRKLFVLAQPSPAAAPRKADGVLVGSTGLL